MSLQAQVEDKTYFLGRLPSTYDRRNENYAIERLFDVGRPLKSRTWTPGINLDQGNTPSCTGHAARGWELCTPVPDPATNADSVIPSGDAVKIWQQAQIVDFGHTDPNNGATIHGIAKALHDPNNPLSVNGRARMKRYVWARTMNGVLYYLAHNGPLILGISWYNSMFNPNNDGVITVDPESGLAGGHAILAYGVDMENLLIRVRNSWGASWGKQGDFFMTFRDAQQLIIDENGEACSGTEQAV